jgi:hypothetical protein
MICVLHKKNPNARTAIYFPEIAVDQHIIPESS